MNAAPAHRLQVRKKKKKKRQREKKPINLSPLLWLSSNKPGVWDLVKTTVTKKTFQSKKQNTTQKMQFHWNHVKMWTRVFLITECRGYTTITADLYCVPILTPLFPPSLNLCPLLQQVPAPDFTFLVLSTRERIAVSFITLKNATRSPRVVRNGDVNGNNSLFHQALGMSVNEKICALELTAQNSLFSNWHAKILIV